MTPLAEVRNTPPAPEPPIQQSDDAGMSRWKLALGAASLFFFLVGVKRSFRTDDGREILKSDADLLIEKQKDRFAEPRSGGRSGRAEPNRKSREGNAPRDVIRAAAGRSKRGESREDGGAASTERRNRRSR